MGIVVTHPEPGVTLIVVTLEPVPTCEDCRLALTEANTDHAMGDIEAARWCDACQPDHYDGPGDAYYANLDAGGGESAGYRQNMIDAGRGHLL